jgi:hypothetical protein
VRTHIVETVHQKIFAYPAFIPMYFMKIFVKIIVQRDIHLEIEYVKNVKSNFAKFALMIKKSAMNANTIFIFKAIVVLKLQNDVQPTNSVVTEDAVIVQFIVKDVPIIMIV